MIMFEPISYSLFYTNKTYVQKATSLAATLSEVDKFYNKVRYKFATNNWLKMHGYPMRRK